MTDLGRHLLDELGPEEMIELARRLAPLLPKPDPPARNGWLTSREAADYLGISLDSLHQLTASRRIPFEQRTQRGRLYFDPAALDDWRRGGGAPTRSSHAVRLGHRR
jgi:excisionase family DNA binding protein